MSAVEFDVESGRVESMGVHVVISEKERALMQILFENPGRILGKDELIAHIWPERAEWIDPANLTQLVSKLRRSLRPTGIDRLIITSGRSGYKYFEPEESALRDGAGQHDDQAPRAAADQYKHLTLQGFRPFVRRWSCPGVRRLMVPTAFTLFLLALVCAVLASVGAYALFSLDSRRPVAMTEHLLRIGDATVRLHLVNSPTLSSEVVARYLIQHAGSGATDVFVAREGDVVFLSYVGASGSRNEMIAAEEVQ